MKFLAKLGILVKNRNCGKTSQFRCGKNIFDKKIFLAKIYLFFVAKVAGNSSFIKKLNFWSKIESFGQNRNFSQKSKL